MDTIVEVEVVVDVVVVVVVEISDCVVYFRFFFN